MRVVTAAILIASLAWATASGAQTRAGVPIPRASAPGIGQPPLEPDIVLILTDDQRWDTLSLPDGTPVMPRLLADVVDRGITFSNGFVVNSLCCPSRASILTGTYSHTTQVYTNEAPYGGYRAFDDRSTIATWLQGAGYRTGLFGKYLNEYNETRIPPGWSEWAAFYGIPNGGAYLDYELNVNGTLESYESEPTDYSTDVLAADVDSFIRSTPPDQPLFAYFAPFGPHKPVVPADRHAGDFSAIPPHRTPNYNEEQIGDKPRWLRLVPPLSQSEQHKTDELRRNQLRALESVDDAVGTIIRALSDTGRLENTLIVFTSDNGLSWGEHRWTTKKTIYDENIRVPFVVRWDSVIVGPRTEAGLVTNIDLAPTFAEVGGITPATPVEGLSLVPLFVHPGVPWRSDFLIEHLNAMNGMDRVNTYCAVRNRKYVYALLSSGEEELYDLGGPRPDPYELRNQAKNPAYAPILETMRARELKLCDPVPPGFDPPLP